MMETSRLPDDSLDDWDVEVKYKLKALGKILKVKGKLREFKELIKAFLNNLTNISAYNIK